MKKQFVFAFVLLVLFSTYKSKKSLSINKLKIETIYIENNLILSNEEIRENLDFLYNTNLLFLNTTSIERVLKKKDFIKDFKIKKIYPNKIKIIVFEKKPIFILQQKKKKFYIDENINLINYLELKDFKDLPVIFGKKEKFRIFYQNLKKINFPFNLIKNYYYFESNRWNLETHEKKIIKLPSDNYIESLKNFIKLQKTNDFEKFKIFDYRINNQLILK
jgi:cell division septal protein FtsQ